MSCKKGLSCPSAQPDMPDARIIGVLGGTPDDPHVAYLGARVHVDMQVLETLGNLEPTEVFRFAARCEEDRCTHFDGSSCRLAARVAKGLPPVVQALPTCQVRADCRWFAEQGKEACYRCPQVVTLIPRKKDRLNAVALPAESQAAT